MSSAEQVKRAMVALRRKRIKQEFHNGIRLCTRSDTFPSGSTRIWSKPRPTAARYRVPKLRTRAAHLKEEMKNAIFDNLRYAHEHGTDRPEVANWTWPY